MKRSTLKRELKAKRATVRRDPNKRRGFRQLHIDGAVWQWRYYGSCVEIRVPGKIQMKWLVQIWNLHEQTQDEWYKAHSECCEDCGAYAVSPGMVRDYIIKRLANAQGKMGKS